MTDAYGVPLGPNRQFWFGADAAGRDLFVRTMYGARTSLFVGIVASGFAVLIGLIVGLTAGFFGGFTDTILSRACRRPPRSPADPDRGRNRRGVLDEQERLPRRITPTRNHGRDRGDHDLLVVVHRAHRARLHAVAAREGIRRVGACGRAPRTCASSRSEILPNLLGPLIVYTTLLIPTNILFEAALSYLGLGVPADQASWGSILSDASQLYDVAWWLMLFPGAFLIITTLAFNLLGDGLRDAFDVRSER